MNIQTRTPDEQNLVNALTNNQKSKANKARLQELVSRGNYSMLHFQIAPDKIVSDEQITESLVNILEKIEEYKKGPKNIIFSSVMQSL